MNIVLPFWQLIKFDSIFFYHHLSTQFFFSSWVHHLFNYHCIPSCLLHKSNIILPLIVYTLKLNIIWMSKTLSKVLITKFQVSQSNLVHKLISYLKHQSKNIEFPGNIGRYSWFSVNLILYDVDDLKVEMNKKMLKVFFFIQKSNANHLLFKWVLQILFS